MNNLSLTSLFLNIKNKKDTNLRGVNLRDVFAKRSLFDLKSIYQDLREKILNNDLNQRKHLASLYSIDQKIKKTIKKKRFYSQHLYLLKMKAKNEAKQVVEMQDRLEEQKRDLFISFKDLYKLSRMNRVQLLFSSLNKAEFDRNFKYLKIIIQSHYEKMEEYKRLFKIYSEKQNNLKKALKKFVFMKKKVRDQEKTMLQIQKKRLQALGILREKKNRYLEDLRSIRKEKRGKHWFAKVKEIDQLYPVSFFQRKGTLSFPVRNGILIQPYGVLRDKIYQFHIPHEGVFYSTHPGSLVYNIHEGKVVFVGKMKGYGNLVIVDHGDHYYSVYANLFRILVKEQGEKVKEFQAIAELGQTQSKRGVGLYFEIRHFSDPMNPLEWFKDEKNHEQGHKRKRTILGKANIK